MWYKAICMAPSIVMDSVAVDGITLTNIFTMRLDCINLIHLDYLQPLNNM